MNKQTKIPTNCVLCPDCGAWAEFPVADIGVGEQQCGPARCEACGWEEPEPEFHEIDNNWIGEQHRLCPKCQDEEKQSPHTCPFKVELAADRETLCTCRSECAHQCAMDV